MTTVLIALYLFILTLGTNISIAILYSEELKDKRSRHTSSISLFPPSQEFQNHL